MLFECAFLPLFAISCEQKKPVKEVPDQIAVGKSSYDNYCKGCHGNDGALGLMNAANLQMITLDSLALSKVILKGKGNMQWFEWKIHNKEIGEIIFYVSQFKNIKH